MAVSLWCNRAFSRVLQRFNFSASSRNIYGLALLCVLLLSLPVGANAFLPTRTGWQAYDEGWATNIVYGATKLEACKAAVDAEMADRDPFAQINYYFTHEAVEPKCEITQRAIGGPGSCCGWEPGTPVGSVTYAYVDLTGTCPANSARRGEVCQCNTGYQDNLSQTACVAAPPEPVEQPASQSCKAPVGGLMTANPILLSSGEKYRFETDFEDGGPAPLSFARTYRSGWGLDSKRPEGAMGQAWTHNFTTTLKAEPAGSPTGVSITTSEGYLRTFRFQPETSNWRPGNSVDSLTRTPEGAWLWRRADDDTAFVFTAEGRLQLQTARSGWSIQYAYDPAGRLASVTNSFGRSLAFGYNGAGLLATLTMPDLRVFGYTYDAQNRLTSVIYPDATVRAFHYESTKFPRALTGLSDETGARFANFSYYEWGDSVGRAYTSELAGGVQKYTATYASSVSGVTDGLGNGNGYRYSAVQGKLAVLSASNAEIGFDKVSRRVQDDNGLIISETDFKDVKTSITWDVARRLPTSTVRAAGTPEAQTVTTQWHPSFALPELVSETGRTTAYTYDVLGNPLSKTVADTKSGKAQVWRWTYNAQQLLETETEPNGATTRYTYDTRGNLLSSTNAGGHVRLYGYDTANRLVSATDPNGVEARYAYDRRDRLLSVSVGTETTTLTYKPYGSVETVTLPSGLVLTYTYDPAHRLTGWSNNRGESGTFTLDAMGNRTGEKVLDGAGAVAWTVVRTFGITYSPGLLKTMSMGTDLNFTYDYDNNGIVRRARDGVNDVDYGHDALGRLSYVYPATDVRANLKYDALDGVIEAKDFKGTITTYARDANGNATSETSPDIGAKTIQYDLLGLSSQVTDALNQATTITRDLLGRPTRLDFADGKVTTLRYDRTAGSKGYLSGIENRSGTTEYVRDAKGRVVLKKQTLANGSVQEVAYGYNDNGMLASMRYPNGGGLLTYAYDLTGRLSGLNLNGKPLVTDIRWNPLGQPTGWRWAFGNAELPASRVYDTAGRMTATGFSSYVYDAAGRIKSLTQNVYRPGPDPEQASVAGGNVTWTVGYDKMSRITSFKAPDDAAEFAYDYNNGNRTKSLRTKPGSSIERSYTVASNSNLLTGVTQKINGASSTAVKYDYNANGDLMGDGLRSYVYDAEGRLAAATTGASDVSPTTRYAHNALGQRVFKTEPLYPPVEGGEGNPGVLRSLASFFAKFWNPGAMQAEQLGFAYVYDEQGTLVSEIGSGGAQSAGQTQYIYLPTPAGPMPIAAVINGLTYAVHSDHLNTPRLLTDEANQPVWQWTYSAFGEDEPTTARHRFAVLDKAPNPGTTGLSELKFNLRYPGQYADEESGLSYNYFRSYDARTGRYTQPDPIGLDGGWNRFGYVDANPLGDIDPTGLRRYYEGDLLRGPVAFDSGVSCKLGSAAPKLDEHGCISTGGGPSICIGPGALQRAGLPVPLVADPKLGNLVKDLFKGARMPTPIGTGSTADAIRNELATGLPTAGKFHSQKGGQYAAALENWLKRNPNASNYDRLTAESLKNDLLNAIKGN